MTKQVSTGPRIVNLTPHSVVVRGGDGVETAFPSEGQARVTDDASDAPQLAGVPVAEVMPGKVTGLPEPTEGVVYLVSRVLAAACPERTDLVFPFREIRDEGGAIAAVSSLARFSPPIRTDSPESPRANEPASGQNPAASPPATSTRRRAADSFWRVIDWLSSLPTAIKIGLSMVLASSVGYLLEVAILENNELFIGGNRALLVVGVLASVVSSVIWGASQASGAHRGVFIHAVGDVRLARHLGEDAILRAKARERWPNAPVLSFRPVLGTPAPQASGDNAPAWQSMAHELGVTVAQQASRSRAVAPASRVVTILPGGPPNTLVVAGATFHHLWHQDSRRLRFAADDTSDSGEPFVDFDLPEVPEASRAAGDMDSDDGNPAVLLIISNSDGERLTAVKNSITEAFEPGELACVEHPGVIAEQSTAYRGVIDSVVQELKTLQDHRLTQVVLLGDAPASIMFAAGYAAAHMGFTVASAPWQFASQKSGKADPDKAAEGANPAQGQYKFDQIGWADDVSEPGTFLDCAYQGRPSAWWSTLITRSLAIGVFLPVVGGSLALALEWWIADSQEGRLNLGNWTWLAATFTLSLAVVLGVTARTSRVLNRPQFRITTGRCDGYFPSLGRREVVVPHSVKGDSLALSRHVAGVFCDAVTALPELMDVTVDVRGCAAGDNAIHDRREGLRKSLRGNKPVVLTSDTGTWDSGPDPGKSNVT